MVLEQGVSRHRRGREGGGEEGRKNIQYARENTYKRAEVKSFSQMPSRSVAASPPSFAVKASSAIRSSPPVIGHWCV